MTGVAEWSSTSSPLPSCVSLCFYLVLSASGAVWSFDQALSRREQGRGKISSHREERQTERDLSFSYNLDYFIYYLNLNLNLILVSGPFFKNHQQLSPLLSARIIQLSLWDYLLNLSLILVFGLIFFTIINFAYCYWLRFFDYLFGINSTEEECVYLGERAWVPWVVLVPGKLAACNWDTTWRAPTTTGAAPANTCSEKSWQSVAAVMPGSEVSDSGVLILTVL